MKRPAADERGTSLVMLVTALATLSLLVLLVADTLRPTAQRRGAEGCAAVLAASMRLASIEATASGRSTALVFPRVGRDEPLRWVYDGDSDGVRRDDIDAAIDTGDAAFWLSREVDDCRIGRPTLLSLTELPPSSVPLSAADPSVRFGISRMAVFTPEGTATAGSLFVTAGGTAVCAVVVNGASARTRLYCWNDTSRRWQPR